MIILIVIIILSLFHLSSCKYHILKIIHTTQPYYTPTLYIFSHLFIIHAQSYKQNKKYMTTLHSKESSLSLQKCRKFKSSSPFPTTSLLLASPVYLFQFPAISSSQSYPPNQPYSTNLHRVTPMYFVLQIIQIIPRKT